jgi:beta-mannosidase
MTVIVEPHRQTVPAIDLTGWWRLAEQGGPREAEMRVPGDVHSALFDARLIPDPYAARNEYDLRWVAEREWLLSREFDLPGGSELDGWVMEVDQLDTIAELRLNGEPLIEAGNAFRRYRARLDGRLKAAGNRIVLLFRSAPRVANARQAAQPFPVPWHAGNSPIPNGNMLRKPQCHFGWDWNIALAPLGLYGNVRLRHAPDALIDAVLVHQAHAAGSVTVDVEARLDTASPAVLPYSIALGEQVTSGIVDLARESRIRVSFVIDNPDLWWPAGLGPQTLQELVVSVGGVEERRSIGLRSVRLLSEPDEVGRSFRVAVNGKEVFCRGANWIPADALPGRITREKTQDLLHSAVAANMNMLRVWGGGQYEPDWFYDLCDELGLLVWQDFMFACHLYPADEKFLAALDQTIVATALPTIGAPKKGGGEVTEGWRTW